MDDEELTNLTATEIAAAITEGRLDPERLARACLGRIAERDAGLKAWSFVDPAAILRDARDLSKSPSRGPLHGVPIAVKDIIDTADMPTGYNSPLFAGHRPRLDASCVATLRAAGALVVGKTETTEFAAAGRNPPTRNPHDLTRTSGGSSAGSAAAVADRHVPLALGTQTGGSTIRPASFCGIFALKPSWGLVSREGVRIYSPSLDTVSWFARSLPDLDLLAGVFGLAAPAAPPPPIGHLRIAICRSPQWPEVEPAMRDALANARHALERAGAGITDLELPEAFAGLPRAQDVIAHREGGASFRHLYAAGAPALHEDFRRMVENRDGFTDQDLRKAHDLAARCREAFDTLASTFDAVLTPSAKGEAPAGAGTGSHVLNQIWSVLHVPCINLPRWRSPAGLPLGLTLVGPRFSDRTLLATAAVVDAAIDGERRERRGDLD